MFPQGGSFTDEVHVLLVHSDNDILNSMRMELQSCLYKVTGVKLAYEAISIISKKKHKVDIILADVELHDLDVFELLHLAVSRKVPTILMSTRDDFDMMLPMKAIENGALKFLMNPITVETLRYLQQYVARDKLEKGNKLAKKGYKANKKTCIKWTDELHAKFVDAVNELRDGSCFPTRIRELMNVPGLTRIQVASHLQKFREGTWRVAPKARRRRTIPEKFGRIPISSGESSSNAQSDLQVSEENIDTPNNLSPTVNNNKMDKETGENVDQSLQPLLVYQPFVSQPFVPHSSMSFVSQPFVPHSSSAAAGIAPLGISSNQKQPLEELFDFISDNAQGLPHNNFSGLPHLNHNWTLQQRAFNYENFLSEQNHMASYNQTRGPWSAGTTNYHGHQP